MDRSAETIAVIMDFEQQYSPVSLEAMEREMDSIMRSCRLNVEWRVLDQNTPKEAFENLVVARFKGKCRDEGPSSLTLQTRTLGLTHISEGEILPFSEVDCDKVREFVEPRLRQEKRPHAEQLLGRALGRVLAHEMYHILAKTRLHGSRGIAKPVLTPRDLLDGDLQFEQAQTDGMHARLKPARRRNVKTSAFLGQ